MTYGKQKVVSALAKNANVTRSIIALFDARHKPAMSGDREKEVAKYVKSIKADLEAV